MSKTAERIRKKLERYEQESYNDGCGADWLSEIGEGIKFHAEDCIKQNKSMTLKSLENYIDDLYKNGQLHQNVK